jgi:secretory lipase
MRVRAYAITSILAACFAVAGCSPPPLHTDGREAGHIEIVPIKTYPTIQSRILLWAVGVHGVPAANAVDCYRVVYTSRDENGKPIALSGLLALPHGVAARGLVSFQHGTTSSRDFVPSNLSTDGLAAAIVFAGNGYAAIAPDYVGLGVSKRPHTYYVASDTARAVVDMIHAARHIAGVPAGPPFLIGFSEGGYASLVAQQALEASGEKVLADAAVSGAYNLRAVSVPWTLKGASPNASTYLALWVRSYATRYGHSLESAFAPRYAVLVPQLFDTPHDVEAILKALPRDPRRLFTPAVLDAIAGRGDHWLVDALIENGIGGWPAKAPIRLYYGTHDVDVLPLEATTTARLMAARGSDIRAVNVGTVGHDGTILAAAPLILEWLETLSAKPKAPVR